MAGYQEALPPSFLGGWFGHEVARVDGHSGLIAQELDGRGGWGKR